MVYQKKPDIDISLDNNSIFYNACICNNIRIAKWLVSINSNYKIIIEHDKIIDYYVLRSINIDPIIKIDLKTIEEEDKECPVCYENIVNIQTGCKHNFCKDCIQIVYNKNDKCPYCRNSLDLFYLIE